MANKTALSANFGRVYNLPSSVLKHILAQDFSRDNPHPVDILLVNKRFYILAKPFLLSTIFLRSELAVLQLLRCLARDSSKVAHDWSGVREIELLFSPSLSRVRLTGTDIFARVLSFPNLRTIRFLFDCGTPYAPGQSDLQVYDFLTSDTTECMRADSPVYKLLSIQKPRTFEWFATDPNFGNATVEKTIHFCLQTFSGALRSMFESWDHLTQVHLHDMCLLNFPSSSFSVALPANNVHISACASLRSTNEAWSFFSIPGRLEGSPRCQRLVLELTNDLYGPQVLVDVGHLPFGTVLSVVGFSSDQRRVIGAMHPDDSQSDEIVVPCEVVSEDTSFHDDVTGSDQEIAAVMEPQEPRTRSPTKSDTHHMVWLLFRVPTQLGHYCISIAAHGARIVIRSIDITISDLRAYLDSIRVIRDGSLHQAPSRIPVGLPHITQFLVSVIFASLLAWRTFLVFIRTALTEIRALVAHSEMSEDRDCSAANSEEDATLHARMHCSPGSPCLSGPLLIPAHEGCTSPL